MTLGQNMETGREKYWSELDETGKVERMRAVVQVLQEQMGRLTRDAEVLQHHIHVDDRIAFFDVPRNLLARQMQRHGIQGDDVYF